MLNITVFKNLTRVSTSDGVFGYIFYHDTSRLNNSTFTNRHTT